MKITVINGTAKRGVTYLLKEIFLSEFGRMSEVTEFYLPDDCQCFCVGCIGCFLKGEQTCKDADIIQPIQRALMGADLIVMTSPAYAFHASGAMKALLDHFAYRWMPHRPAPSMFTKRAVVITQCLGAGANTAAKDIRHSLSWWGISKIGTFSGRLMSDIVWDKLPDKKQAGLIRRIKRLAQKFARIDYTRPARMNIVTKIRFNVCRMMQKSLHKADPDYLDGRYWEEQGWL